MAQKSSKNRSGGSGSKKGSLREHVVSVIIMAAIGLAVYKGTGLYDAAEAGVATVGFGAAIVFWFIYNLRNATIRHRKR